MKLGAAALIAVSTATTGLAQMTPAPTPALALAPAPATPLSQWRVAAHATGTGYETGTFDQSIDGGLRVACTSNGAASLAVQIKGVAPAAGSRFLLIPATRQGRSQTLTFTAGPDGQVTFARARSDRQLARLWAALRGGNNATVRYADGSFSVQSLIGATAVLPARPCG